MKNLYRMLLLLMCTATTMWSNTTNAQDLASDSLALVDLYNNCGGSNWVGFGTWLNGPISTWEKVTVDPAMQRVTNVEFKDMELTGTLPASLGNMDEMSGKIEFRDDTGLTGALPAFLWNWTKIDRFQIKFSGYTSIDTTGMSNMVNLTEFNTEGTPIGGMIPGVIFTLPAIEKLYFHNSEFDMVPPELLMTSGLTRLYLNGDNITDLPDMSGMTWGSGAKVRVQDNGLTFEDLEVNMALSSDPNVGEFNFSPQAMIGMENYQYPAAGSTINFDATVGGTANVYTWIKDGVPTPTTTPMYDIASFDANMHSGTYSAIVQNTMVPGLDIMTANMHLFASTFAQDSLALVALYNDCGGANWSGFSTWLNGPLATWEKVTVDATLQRVTNVEFKDMELTGTLPSALGNMDEMSGKIEFRDDTGLTGALPAFLWKWTKIDRFQIKFSGYTSIDVTGMSNMVNLTEFNTEGTPIGGMIPGVIFTLPAIEKLYFHNSEFDQVPPELLSTSGLTRLYLNGDNITDLPDLSGITWGSGAKVRVQDNALTFEDLEANMALTTNPDVGEFNFSPQAMIGMENYQYPAAGSMVSLDATVGGTMNAYTWLKDGTPTVTTTPMYDIASFDASMHSGTYAALIQSTLVPGLDLMLANQHLFASELDQDSLALVDLYNACGGTTWSGFSTWLNGRLKDWEQVTVDSATQRVTHVNFKNMDLSGTLNTSLGNITKMSGKIEFHDDSLLTGELPAALWRWVDVDRFQLKRSGVSSVDTEGMENMVNLTEYNTEANPITGAIPGVVFTLPAMEKVYVHDCEYDQVPSELMMATQLDRLYFNGNNLVDIPDMSGMTWGDGAKIRVQDNALTFEDLEPNVIIASDSAVEELKFSPQAKVGMATVIDLATGDSLGLSIAVGGSANQYSWIKDSAQVGGDMLYEVTSVSVSDVGDYYLLVQSPLVLGLDITSETYQVNVDGITGIEDLSYFGDIKVLGNPVASNLRIEAAQIIEQVQILDLSGKQVSLEITRNRSIDVPVDHLTPGIYFVVLRAGNFAHTLKVVKR